MDEIYNFIGCVGGLFGIATFFIQNVFSPKASKKEHVKEVLEQKSELAYGVCWDYWLTDGDKDQKHNLENIVTKRLKEVTIYYTENQKIFGKSFDTINNSFIDFIKMATGGTFGSEFEVKDGSFGKELTDVYMRYKRSLSF